MRIPENLPPILTNLGLDSHQVIECAQSDEGKQEADTPLERGVFGSPYFIVGENRFWADARPRKSL